ncbi:MAG: metallophosphoesterase family protein [Ferruginibacter sp.]
MTSTQWVFAPAKSYYSNKIYIPDIFKILSNTILTTIGLISDTHYFLDKKVFTHFAGCDEIWHAGDFGNIDIADSIATGTGKTLKGVSGNIDGMDVRIRYPEQLHFLCEDVQVFIKHIGGYPGKYAPGIKNEIIKNKPGLFICGHSHILKIMYDDKLGCLHINPGAAGKQGWHSVRTIIKFVIDGNNIRDCKVIELGDR